MESWRWMSRDLGEGYVVSNVPEYLTRVVRGGVVIATHKAVVGKASTPTPQLNPMATGVIINPTWTQIGRDTSELQSLMSISYAVFVLKKKKKDSTSKYNICDTLNIQ